MNKSFLLISLFISSCANIQHLTNVNLADIQGISTNQSLRDKYNTIKEIKKDETSHCKSLGKVKAQDNGFDTGEQYAVLYLKAAVMDLKGDSVLIEKKETVGDYGHKVYGEAFKCIAAN